MPRSLTTHIDTPAAFGERLRSAREAQGTSQRKLSFPGCTAAYISRLEAGARVPSLQMVEELALRLSVDPRWLAKGKKNGKVADPELTAAYQRIRQLERTLQEVRRVVGT